jgi:polar amino acid transport system substrate-binding protein
VATTGESFANENKPEGAEVVSFEDADGMFGALASGDVAAVLQDLPVNALRAKQDSAFVLTETFATDEQYAFAVEKGDTEMVEFLNAGLATLEEDGRLAEIYGTYFEESE